ncbi:MAG TPA: hypothetical protein PLA50_17845 [Bacteroidia bacterium]|nr:hypothetical protein [Bacteroidia bacterium]
MMKQDDAMRYDPALYFGLAFSVLSIQCLVWIIGRYSLELDWWRTLPFAYILNYAFPIVAAKEWTLQAVGVCYVVSAMVVWALSGFLYEPERWQRCVMSAVFPALGIVALPIGVWLRKTVFGW